MVRNHPAYAQQNLEIHFTLIRSASSTRAEKATSSKTAKRLAQNSRAHSPQVELGAFVDKQRQDQAQPALVHSRCQATAAVSGQRDRWPTRKLGNKQR